jgi:hypothetical protein
MAEAEVDQIAQRPRAIDATVANFGVEISLWFCGHNVNAVQWFHSTDSQHPKRALAKYIPLDLRPRRKSKMSQVHLRDR